MRATRLCHYVYNKIDVVRYIMWKCNDVEM